MAINFPDNPSLNDTVVVSGKTYRWNNIAWVAVGPDKGFTGSRGFTGSQGANGFTGSQGADGFTGSRGFTGSQGADGFTGSQGNIGFTGSQGNIGFTGSQGPAGDNFNSTTVSGTTQTLDVGSFNFFDGGDVSSDITLAFSNVPTSEASWTWTANFNLGIEDISNATYDSVSFSISGQEVDAQAITFNNNGDKVYILGKGSNTVYQYSLTTAWDVSTASYDSVSFSVSSQDTTMLGLEFNDDGTKLFTVGSSTDSVHQYSLTTAYDISTASYDSVSLSVSSQDTVPQGITFSDDGTKLYITGDQGNDILQYTLGTAWDLSTASWDSVSFSVAGQDSSPSETKFLSNGTKMYVLGAVNDVIFQYTLGTAWDITTASYDSVSFSVSSQEPGSRGFEFSNDGTKLYVVGENNDAIFQYTLPIQSQTVTMPASVSNNTTYTISTSTQKTFEFFTTNGGTNIHIIGIRNFERI